VLKLLPIAPLRARALALCAAALLVPAAFAPAHAQVNLPALGDSVSEDFSVGTEKKIGVQIMREIRRDPDYLDDPVLLDYVQSMWQPLMAAARQRGDIGGEANDRFAWEPFLVRDRSVNAFALPGGYVGVHLGLIAITAGRDELASVLAHELSHVTQRHIARSIVNSQRQSMLSLATMILGAVAASRSSNVDAANAIFVGGQAAAAQGQLNFSRDMEREADRVGYAVLTGAGFAPSGMAAMFEKLENAARHNDGNSFPYLRSHPLTTERIGEARARQGTGRSGALAPASALEHAVMQARARVLMDARAIAWQRLQTMDVQSGPGMASGGPERLSALCTSALASSSLRDWPRAESAIQTAHALLRANAQPDARAERALAMLHAQLLLERGDAARGAELLKPHAADASRSMALLRAQLAIGSSRDEAALRRQAEELQTRVALAPLDATAWTLLGQAQERLGHPLRALRSQAEARYAIGDLSGAVDRLRAGQRAARGSGGDHVEASVIDARLRDVEAERKQWAAELRREGRSEP
jgi:predicted Zn-dependent protease